MTLQGPLSIHVSGMGLERHLEVTDLEFTRSAQGGFTSATFTMPAWADSDDAAIGPVARVMVDDGRTGKRVFEGFLDLAGKTVDNAGHTWQVGAVGSQSVLADRSKAYISIDATFDGWQFRTSSNANMTGEAASLPTDDTTDALVLQWPNGSPVQNGSFVSMRYSRIADGGQTIGSIYFTHVEGFVSGDDYFRVRLSGGGPNEYPIDMSADTTPVTRGADAGGTAMAVGHTLATMQWLRESGGATNVATDDAWSAVTDVKMIALRQDQTGADISGTSSYNNYVLAHEVIIDALWNFTNQIDVPNASIDETFTYQIDQLAYPDGIRLPDMLNDLALLEPDMLWEVLESNPAGLHRFNLRRWPTDVRYEAESIDGWSSPGGEVSYANALRVYWTDRKGAPQSTDFSTDVPALDQWGRVRDAESVQLGAEIGSQGAANQIGAAVLAQTDVIPYAGTLTVARPIRDLHTGREVQPWEIEPGYLVSVRDLDIPPMRLTEVTYRDSDLSAALTLGTPVYSTDEMVSRLVGRRNRHGSVTPNALGKHT